MSHRTLLTYASLKVRWERNMPYSWLTTTVELLRMTTEHTRLRQGRKWA